MSDCVIALLNTDHVLLFFQNSHYIKWLLQQHPSHIYRSKKKKKQLKINIPFRSDKTQQGIEEKAQKMYKIWISHCYGLTLWIHQQRTTSSKETWGRKQGFQFWAWAPLLGAIDCSIAKEKKIIKPNKMY